MEENSIMADVSVFNIMGQNINVRDTIARNGVKDNSDKISKISNALNGVKCLLIGDSYNRGTGGTVGRGWGYYFQQSTACDATIWQNAGGGFVTTGGPTSDFTGMNFLQILQQEVPKMSADEKQKIKLVIFAGGYNDGKSDTYNESSLVTQITNCVSYIKENLPNARIAIIPLWNEDPLDVTEHILCYQVMNYTAQRLGVYTSTSSMFWFIGYNNYGAGDGVHLNDAGYERCGNLIASCIYGFNGSYSTPLNGSASGSLDLASGVTVASGQRFRIYEKDGIVYVFGALAISNIQASMTLLNSIPDSVRTWGTLNPICVIQTSSKYVHVNVAIDQNNMRLTADIGDLAGQSGTLRCCFSYPLGM